MASPVSDVVVKWSGKEYKITGLLETHSVINLKEMVQKETGVLPERQKLLGLKFKGIIFDGSVSKKIGPHVQGSHHHLNNFPTWAFLSLAQSKLRLCPANHMAGYFSNVACDWSSCEHSLSLLQARDRKQTQE